MPNNSQNGIIFNIQRFAIHDGPGIRTTVFLKGCPLRCWWCHNPESHKLLPEKFDGCNLRRGFDHSFSMDKDEIGQEISVDDLTNEINKDRMFYDESSGGVTFSGGEPFMQLDFLLEVLTGCKNRDINTVIDTSGYAPWNSFENVLEYTDLFLFDLKIEAGMKKGGLLRLTAH